MARPLPMLSPPFLSERVQDFDGSSVNNLCFPTGSIQKFFPAVSKDPSVTFDSPSKKIPQEIEQNLDAFPAEQWLTTMVVELL